MKIYSEYLPLLKTEISEKTETTLNGLLKGSSGTVTLAEAGTDFLAPPLTATELPASGEPLASNTMYTVSDPVGVYVFTPPATGWAMGTFTTDAEFAISFSEGSDFAFAAPEFGASERYEFSVLNGVWAFAEVVSA